MTLRSVTNLTPNASLTLPRQELKTGFLYVYNKGYTGYQQLFMAKLWISTLCPALAADPNFGKDRKALRSYTDNFAKHVRAGLTDVRKVHGEGGDDHFLVSVPVGILRSRDIAESMRYLAFSFGVSEEHAQDGNHVDLQDKLQSETNALGKNIGSVTYPGNQVVANVKGLDARARLELDACLKSMRIVSHGDSAQVFLDFKLSAPICQQLTNTAFVEIRPIDLYPLMLQWVVSVFGSKSPAPISSFPISKIARTLPPVADGDARINENNLSIGPDGRPYWLPGKLDNTGRYEDLFTQAGVQDDGGFRLANLEDDITAVNKKLPSNIPVLIDWVNNKYAYTTVNGTLKVQDLSRFKTADHSHIYNIMTRFALTDDVATLAFNMAATAGVSIRIQLSAEEIAEMNETLPGSGDALATLQVPGEYFGRAMNTYRQAEEMSSTDTVPLKDFTLDGSVYLRPIVRIFIQAHAAILQNLDAVNARYAVSTVSIYLAILTLVAKYGADFSDVVMKSNAIRKAASNQSVDPNWTPPSIPLLSDKIGMLPHQLKVRNLLKDSPDFAILPVQAGGGKSVLTITDVLYEIKANTNNPYLILCPPHLVAQYVKEIVYFTSGQVNVITINSYCIRRHGLERLTEMIEHAPRNSVVVCDYDILRQRQQEVCYGTTVVPVYPIIEFLRQFRFGYAMLDESHSVKNDTNRTRACMALIADIPKKRLASGTMAHDSPSDLALQVAMLDPTLFGSRSEFNERFGDTVSGDRVLSWKPQAQRQIMSIIQSRIVVAKAMRKEWAALLPKAHERFHPAELSDAQREVYDAIFAQSMAEIEKMALTNKTLAKFINKDKGTDKVITEEDPNAAVDEHEGEDLASALGPYLARLEQFLCAPARDESGNLMLKGEDRISPKVREIIKCIREHLDANLPGKVLIFTNYTASAEEIYENLPSDLKALTILYKAADKVETGARFEKDDRIKVMIGVENSMNTGLNLQHVARLIRVETVWNPGTLEQGNSRVNRPELKATESRADIFYDWIVVDRTIDVTKISRLVAKVVAIGKFENVDSERYQAVPDIPVLPMNLETIKTYNQWNENLGKYTDALKQYNQARNDDYAEYKREFQAKYGAMKLSAPIEVAPVPSDAALMTDITYTPGLDLYKAGELGLVRVDEYLRQDGTDDSEDDEAGEAAEGAEENGSDEARKRNALASSIVGSKVHTEYGDGVIKTVSLRSKLLNVSLPTGYLVRVKFSAAFLITQPKSQSLRKELFSAVGTITKTTAPLKTLSDRMRPDNAGLRKAEKEKKAAEDEKRRKEDEQAKEIAPIELSLTVSNGFLGVTYFTDDNNVAAANALQALNFRPTPQFAFAEMKTANHLLKQFNAWREHDFTLDNNTRLSGASAAINDLYNLLKTGKLKSRNVDFNFSNRNSLKNFYRSETKPSTSTVEIKPYPMIEDGVAYIVLPLRGQPASRAAMKVRVPGVKWQLSAESLVFYGLDLSHTAEIIKKILAAGIQISNIADLRKDFRHLHKTKLRNNDDSSIA